jgi:hypothetical protein
MHKQKKKTREGYLLMVPRNFFQTPLTLFFFLRLKKKKKKKYGWRYKPRGFGEFPDELGACSPRRAHIPPILCATERNVFGTGMVFFGLTGTGMGSATNVPRAFRRVTGMGSFTSFSHYPNDLLSLHVSCALAFVACFSPLCGGHMVSAPLLDGSSADSAAEKTNGGCG